MTTRGTAALFGGLAILVCGLIISGGSTEKPQAPKPRAKRTVGNESRSKPAETERSFTPSTLPDQFPDLKPVEKFPTAITSEPPARITPRPLATNIATPIPAPELQAMIRRELPEATEQEVGIWAKQLAGMPLSQARELVRIRSQLRDQDATTNRPRLVPFSLGAVPNQPQAIEPPRPTIPHQPFVSQRTERPSDVRAHIAPSLKALQQARNVILNNIANANTPGFKRSVVIFGETPSQSADGVGSGVGIVKIERKSTPIDLKHELAELRKIAEQMKAMQEAARMFDSAATNGFQLQPTPQFPQAKRTAIQPMSARGGMIREADSDRWWREWFMSPKARAMERNLGFDNENLKEDEELNSQQGDDDWSGAWMMFPKAREIERSVGIDAPPTPLAERIVELPFQVVFSAAGATDCRHWFLYAIEVKKRL